MNLEVRKGFSLRSSADYGVAPADFDGDGRADLSVKLDGGTWKIDYSSNGLGSWDVTVESYGDPRGSACEGSRRQPQRPAGMLVPASSGIELASLAVSLCATAAGTMGRAQLARSVRAGAVRVKNPRRSTIAAAAAETRSRLRRWPNDLPLESRR